MLRTCSLIKKHLQWRKAFIQWFGEDLAINALIRELLLACKMCSRVCKRLSTYILPLINFNHFDLCKVFLVLNVRQLTKDINSLWHNAGKSASRVIVVTVCFYHWPKRTLIYRKLINNFWPIRFQNWIMLCLMNLAMGPDNYKGRYEDKKHIKIYALMFIKCLHPICKVLKKMFK